MSEATIVPQAKTIQLYHTEREALCAVLFNGPLMLADALVVLSGDGETRLEAAVQLLHQRAAHHVVVSGGVDDPPHSITAERMGGYLIGKGLAYDRLHIEDESQNTREQAENVLAIAVKEEWARLLLVASPYHVPRAFLTFLKVLIELGHTEDVRIGVLPASHTPWWGSPVGRNISRLELLAAEFRKIDDYQQRGHVASYAEGLAYLEHWEG